MPFGLQAQTSKHATSMLTDTHLKGHCMVISTSRCTAHAHANGQRHTAQAHKRTKQCMDAGRGCCVCVGLPVQSSSASDAHIYSKVPLELLLLARPGSSRHRVPKVPKWEMC